MPAKTPIYLKAPTDRKGRRPKLRDILSGDMISPPLGDVRHSAHVGPQGQDDMFGDVAFLQGSMDILPSLRAPHNGHKPSPQNVSPQQDSLQWGLTSQDQAPPKPPRLHLDPPPQHGSAHYPHLDTPPQHGPASGPHHLDISLAHTIQRLVTSSGSSSEDSLFDTCGPLGAPQGLSLDSDAALSNEDLRSEGSPTTLPRTDSILATLNLDLGPSILEDVLSIMDRYRGPSVSPDP
uniref:Zgc:154093 n=1 Tax=Neogobius melanostomus TaxID=47308 RepID=A0A8C6WPD3_9GOBI